MMSEGARTSNVTYHRSGEILEAEVGDELVALNVAAGDCFGLNEVARTVWRHLAEPKNFAQLRDALLVEYDVGVDQCTAELQELIDDLVAKGLIRSVVE